MDEQKPSKKISKFARFSGIGIQMGAIIALFSWLGNYLDKRQHTSSPWFTIALSLFGVAAALVIVIREVIKMSKEDE